jgi:predicted secreted Zn-dependent protease
MTREQAIVVKCKELQENIENTTSSVVRLEREREERDRVIIQQMSQEIDELVSKMKVEEEQYEGLQGKVDRVSQEITDQIDSDLKIEKTEREKSEDTLLTLLEGICAKIEELT